MMMPWEREIYVSLLVDQVKEEKQAREQQQYGQFTRSNPRVTNSD